MHTENAKGTKGNNPLECVCVFSRRIFQIIRNLICWYIYIYSLMKC